METEDITLGHRTGEVQVQSATDVGVRGATSPQWRGRLWEFFSDPQRFGRLLITLLVAVTVLKGLHRPLAWAYTQAQLNYRFGFVRRGFLGATVGYVFGLQHFLHFCVFSFLVLAMAGLLVLGLLKRGEMRRVVPSLPFAALLASSYALTFMVHIVGYADVLLFALVAGFLYLRGERLRIVLTPVLLGVGLLIHENFMVLFAPVVLLSAALDSDTRQDRWKLWLAMTFAGLAIALTAFIGMSRMSPTQVDAVQAYTLARVDRPVDPVFWDVLQTPLKANVAGVLGYAVQIPIWTRILLPIGALFVPVLSVLTWLNVRLARRLSDHRWMPLSCVLAGWMPVALSVLGTDVARWMADATAASVLVLCMLCMRMGGRALDLPPGFSNLLVLLNVLNLVSGEHLMDGQHINSFPYTDLLVHGAKALVKRI